MVQDEELEFDTPLEEEVNSLNLAPEKRTIHTDSSDPEVELLLNKHKRGKLIVQPDFQRQFVWDGKRASLLVESALLGIPIPIIYVSEEDDNKEYVIDGQQRLTSFFSFIDGTFPNKTDFKLSGLKVFKELNGKKYADLNEENQDLIRYFKLRTVTFKRGSDENLKFEIFERLNTGSVHLNDQELRNCIFRGPCKQAIEGVIGGRRFSLPAGAKGPGQEDEGHRIGPAVCGLLPLDVSQL